MFRIKKISLCLICENCFCVWHEILVVWRVQKTPIWRFCAKSGYSDFIYFSSQFRSISKGSSCNWVNHWYEQKKFKCIHFKVEFGHYIILVDHYFFVNYNCYRCFVFLIDWTIFHYICRYIVHTNYDRVFLHTLKDLHYLFLQSLKSKGHITKVNSIYRGGPKNCIK